MPIIDLILLLIAGITGVIASIIIFRIALKSPIPLLYLFLSIAILSLGLNFLLAIPLIVFNSTTYFSITLTHSQLINVLRLSHFFALAFVLDFTIITYIPTFTVDLKSITIVIFSTMFDTATFIIDSFTFDFKIEPNKIQIVYSNFGLLTLILSLTILIYVLIVRYNEIGKLLKNSDATKFPFKKQFGQRNKFYILILLIIASFISGRLVAFLPGYLWAGFTEIGLVYLIISLMKNSAFYFISDSKLEGIVILNSASGKIQYYKNYQNVDMLLTSVVTAFNISIKQMVSSSTDIQQIIFEDKSLLLSKGKFTTTLVLVTKKTIISDSITKYLAKKFEKIFATDLEKKPFGVDDLGIFLSFNKEITKIQNYFSI